MSFSHSSISSYEKCPLKYKLTRIDRLEEPSGTAAERGTLIHAEFEGAIKGLTLVDTTRTWWIKYLEQLKGKNAQPEVQIGLTKDWQPCDFFSDQVHLRGVFDVIYFEDTWAHVLDWKTGKERDYTEQLKLYAAMIFAYYPSITRVSKEICYIDHDRRVSQGITERDEFESLKAWVDGRIDRIGNDKVYAPKPTYLCKWCHFRKDNGGPCIW
jgi:CRISPR/Cas system-associated exonuclease Cas4 (RecB family)